MPLSVVVLVVVLVFGVSKGLLFSRKSPKPLSLRRSPSGFQLFRLELSGVVAGFQLKPGGFVAGGIVLLSGFGSTFGG